jgi:hypothetical protein
LLLPTKELETMIMNELNQFNQEKEEEQEWAEGN